MPRQVAIKRRRASRLAAQTVPLFIQFADVEEKRSKFWQTPLGARAADALTFVALNAMQLRRGRDATTPAEIEAYLSRHGALTLDEFHAAPGADDAAPVLPPPDAAPRFDPQSGLPEGYVVSWPSPHPSGYAANDRAHVDFFPARAGWPDCPTVFFLHALMSTSDLGYRRWAGEFNRRGWNACFVHLPFHYSRRPSGYLNGELAIGCDMLRTAEGLRQGVKEMRQLRGAFERAGVQRFGIWATSYGGWIAALWACVEAGFRFVALIQPIHDVYDVIWRSPAGTTIRRQLRRRGVTPDLPTIRPLLRLGTPAWHHPLDPGDRILLFAGDYDRAVTPESLAALHERWAGSHFIRGPQGHMGFYLMPAAMRALEAGGFLTIDHV
jgi:hypothetical protein